MTPLEAYPVYPNKMGAVADLRIKEESAIVLVRGLCSRALLVTAMSTSTGSA